MAVHWSASLQVLELLFSNEAKVCEFFSVVLVFHDVKLTLKLLLVLIEIGVQETLSDVRTEVAHENFVEDQQAHLENIEVLVASVDLVRKS